MGWYTDLLTVLLGEFGWAVTVLWFAYQLFWPQYLHWGGGTKLQQIIDGLRKEVHDDIDDVRESIEEYGERQLHIIQIQRANARTNEQLDAGMVDEYLWENDVNPDDFILSAVPDGGERDHEDSEE